MSVDEAMPTELWMLWRVATEDYDEGWVCALDGLPGFDAYLVFVSQTAAKACAKDHRARYGIECHPVRVHPASEIRT